MLAIASNYSLDVDGEVLAFDPELPSPEPLFRESVR